MAPMARTSRRDPSLNALDDLNLDDMFEGGQDGLFDDLGMDLGDLGDITNDSSAVPPVLKGLDDMQFDLLGDIGVDDGATSPAADNKRSRRTTKRKTKLSTPYDPDDDDDDEPSSRKRKRSTSKKAKTPTSKKSKAANESPPPPNYRNKSKTASSSPAIERGTSQSMVAAAGQFGGRNKRGSTIYPVLARNTSKSYKSKSSPQVPAPVASVLPSVAVGKPAEPVPPPASAKRNRSITEVSRPLETLFCGLQPSETLFFPFLPTLPLEPSMKKCNKHYPTLDKLIMSLTPSTSLPELDDALVRLLMFHDAVPTKERKVFVSNAVVAARKALQGVDLQRLAADLQSVAILVKRQHDFLGVSLENMERWCKKNFSADDYRAVYGGEKPKPVLPQLSSPIIRVRINCSGFKEPKLSSRLIAHLPVPGGVAKSSTIPTTIITTIKKKRVEPSVTTVEKAVIEEVHLEYKDLSPLGRRNRITELITKHAQMLETKQMELDESRRKIFDKQSQSIQKVVEDDEAMSLNTIALWKWVEKSGYMGEITEQDIKELLVYQPEFSEEHILWEETTATKSSVKPLRDSLYDRMQALLVDVDDNEDEDVEDDDDDDWNGLKAWHLKNGSSTDGAVMDISRLTVEQKAYLHLRAAGLLDEAFPLPNQYDDVKAEDEDEIEEDTTDFEDLIRLMKMDLLKMDRLNNSRIAFLESSARAHLDVTKQMKRQDERQAQMVNRCNQILKKQKENKRTARQKAQKKDEDWVPW